MAEYRQLSAGEWMKIETLAAEGHSGNVIARRLSRSQSTISCELGRDREGDQPYGAADWERFEEQLKAGWSPEQIAGREQLEDGSGASATWIYKWLWEDRASGGELYLHLRRQGKQRKAKAADGEARRG